MQFNTTETNMHPTRRKETITLLFPGDHVVNVQAVGGGVGGGPDPDGRSQDTPPPGSAENDLGKILFFHMQHGSENGRGG